VHFLSPSMRTTCPTHLSLLLYHPNIYYLAKNTSGSRQGLMAGSCEHSNEPSFLLVNPKCKRGILL
jgi:hypothetical protein